jgi:hypothetical protein
LQREVHNAARNRHDEAAALVARAAVETTVVGLYCLHVPGAVEQMQAGNAKYLNRMFEFLSTEGVFPTGLLEVLVAEIGGEGDLPPLNPMAMRVAEHSQHPITLDLYRRLFIPLSTFFAHGEGHALLRHVDPHDRLHDRPIYPWTIRGALRATDAYVGILATHVARQQEVSADTFIEYADAHWERTVLPLVAMFGRSARRSLRWRKLPQAMMGIRKVVRYYRSGVASSDTAELREERTRRGIEQIVQVLPELPEAVMARAVQELTTAFLSRSESPTDQTGTS